MKNFFTSAFFLFFTNSLLAQKMNPVAFANHIDQSDLKKHLYYLAGKEMEGRETGTYGQRKAASFIESQFKALGLVPPTTEGYQQYFPVFQDSLIQTYIQIQGKTFSLDQDFGVNLSHAHTHGFRQDKVFFVGYGKKEDIKNLNLVGKVVLMIPQEGDQNNMKTVEELQKAGVVAILTPSSNFPRGFKTLSQGQMFVDGFSQKYYPNQYFISEEMAKQIMGNSFSMDSKTTYQPKEMNCAIEINFIKKQKMVWSSNVIGVLEGSELKNEYVFITAHYDHLGQRDSVIYYGADDDGSGTVGLLEMAEAFAKAKEAGKGPKRSIVFMAVSGEEEGLWGSEYFVNHPLLPLDKISADLNIDMIGRMDETRTEGNNNNYVYVIGFDRVSSELKPISDMVVKKYTKLELDDKYNDPKDVNQIFYRSDHYNFAQNGVPILFFYDGMLGGDYHQPTDTPEKINYDLLEKRTKHVFYTAWEIANRKEMLKRDRGLEPGSLE